MKTDLSDLEDVEPVAAGSCGGVVAAGAALLQEGHDWLHTCGVKLVARLHTTHNMSALHRN